MDFGDGEIRFRFTLGVADGILTDGQIENAVDEVLNGMDYYFPALMDVIYGGKDPANAFAEAEAKDQAGAYHESATGREFVEKEVPARASGLVH